VAAPRGKKASSSSTAKGNTNSKAHPGPWPTALRWAALAGVLFLTAVLFAMVPNPMSVYVADRLNLPWLANQPQQYNVIVHHRYPPKSARSSSSSSSGEESGEDSDSDSDDEEEEEESAWEDSLSVLADAVRFTQAQEGEVSDEGTALRAGKAGAGVATTAWLPAVASIPIRLYAKGYPDVALGVHCEAEAEGEAEGSTRHLSANLGDQAVPWPEEGAPIDLTLERRDGRAALLLEPAGGAGEPHRLFVSRPGECARVRFTARVAGEAAVYDLDVWEHEPEGDTDLELEEEEGEEEGVVEEE
jgi:hypothetical protein